MKALSIRQPWAWAIIHAGKDVENRDWPTKFRGRVLIHAGVYRPNQADVDEFNSTFFTAVPDQSARHVICPRWTEALSFERGGIVGSVEIVDCVRESASPWFFGPYGFVLRNARPLPFYPCKGRLGFFDVDYPHMGCVADRSPDEIAHDAYAYADAMLKAREAGNG